MHIHTQTPVLGGHFIMNYLYLCASSVEIPPYQDFIQRNKTRIESFIECIEQHYAVSELPNAVILTSAEIATKKISSIPLPGYTNEFRTVFCPDPEVWKGFYLQQLTGTDDPKIRKYYDTEITEGHVLQILGHEFVHHSDLFIDEAYENARWFEEGMCEYISRKFFLTEAQFQHERQINKLLVQRYEVIHQKQALENFTRDIYGGAMEDIFYFYWKSFLAVDTAVRKLGSVEAVFQNYHRWFREKSAKPLSVLLEI